MLFRSLTVGFVAAAVMVVFAGLAADTWGRRWTLAGLLALSAACVGASGLVTDLTQLTVLRALAFRLRAGAQGVLLLKPQFELPTRAVKGGDVLQQDDGGATTGIPTFTLPAADSLTLTVPPTDTLPLPGVVTTDTAPLPTDTALPTDSIEVFTDTSSTVPPVTETTGVATTVVG